MNILWKSVATFCCSKINLNFKLKFKFVEINMIMRHIRDFR